MLNLQAYERKVPRNHPGYCERCSGSGCYVTGTVNGKLSGPGGECFRCGGKGFQTADDERRNAAYDRIAVARAFRQMCGGGE